MNSRDFETGLEESVSNLKRVLPIMTRQRVPTTPANYDLWYRYITREYAALCDELDALLARGVTLTPQLCRELHARHIGSTQSAAEAETLRAAIQDMAGRMLEQLEGFGHDISGYGSVLAASGSQLATPLQPAELRALLAELIDETEKAHSRSQQAQAALVALSNELTDLRDEVRRLDAAVRTDQLTGLANRRAFDDALARLVREANEGAEGLCLAMLDIDHFKRINDGHGHLTGDHVIRIVAQELQQCTRAADVVARYGGEEYALLLPATTLESAVMLCDDIRSLIEAQAVQDVRTGIALERVTVSAGVALYRRGEPAAEFVARADQCLYASKQRGRNRVTPESQLTPH
jgi:diguanylate cyclase